MVPRTTANIRNCRLHSNFSPAFRILLIMKASFNSKISILSFPSQACAYAPLLCYAGLSTVSPTGHPTADGILGVSLSLGSKCGGGELSAGEVGADGRVFCGFHTQPPRLEEAHAGCTSSWLGLGSALLQVARKHGSAKSPLNLY